MRRRHHPSDHLTFRVGIHACVGQNLAKLEAHALLTALLARVRRFEIGKPEFIVHNTLHGLSKLPLPDHHLSEPHGRTPRTKARTSCPAEMRLLPRCTRRHRTFGTGGTAGEPPGQG